MNDCDYGGMTNAQYKGMLLDELSDWEELLRLVREGDIAKVKEKTERQIEKIHKKMMF